MAIGGSDLFRVIVLHGVFVPGARSGARGYTVPNGKNALGPLRAYDITRTGCRAPFSNANAHTGCDGITNSERADR